MPVQVVRKDSERKARFDALRRSERLIRDNMAEWRERFRGEFVAVHDGEVVARARRAEDAWAEVLARGLPTERVIVVHVPEEDVLAFY